jgi:hypothetical protein
LKTQEEKIEKRLRKEKLTEGEKTQAKVWLIRAANNMGHGATKQRTGE